MYAIKTENMTKFYNKARGVIGLDIEVREGDFFGFVGPNGAGKSTAIRALLGLISLTDGRAEVLGQDVKDNSRQILSEVGYLPSETNFYACMKVSQLLELSARLRKKDCSSEAAMLCERLLLDPDKKISELSLGNRKKVGIVAALQHRPKLYILDEPTSGLDPLMQKEFYSILRERNNEGATVFLSSHILSEVEKHCKRAAIIREGRILAVDSVEKLSYTGVKRVILKGDDVSVAENDERLSDIVRTDEGVSFLYKGESEELVAMLSKLRFCDFTVSDPDLEEVFMHYYEKGED